MSEIRTLSRCGVITETGRPCMRVAGHLPPHLPGNATEKTVYNPPTPIRRPHYFDLLTLVTPSTIVIILLVSLWMLALQVGLDIYLLVR